VNIPDFSNCRILVVGDLMLDQYCDGDTSRISPEAPVPVVKLKKTDYRAGGACNVAMNLAVLGCQVKLLGFKGNDEAGDILARILAREGIENVSIRSDNCETIKKLRVISRNQQLIRLDIEQDFYDFNHSELESKFNNLLSDTDVIILSDYCKGTLKHPEALIKLAQAKHIPVIVDPKQESFVAYAGARVITPNLNEFEKVVGPCKTAEEIIAKARQEIQKNSIDTIVVTQGSRGMTIVTSTGLVEHIPAKSNEVYDVTGAGDTVISVIAASLAAGLPIMQAANLANVAAGIVVGKVGTSVVTPLELSHACKNIFEVKTGIVAEEELKDLVKLCQSRGEKIVMINGCYDIIHYGHIRYFNRAKSYGDRLIIAVNNDCSVSLLKGLNRPVNSLDFRMEVLSNIKAVDWVVPFAETTPGRIVEAILPDILVKGSENFKTIADIPENEGVACVLNRGGKVHLVPRTEGISSTELIGV
jgi:D-beta-D-heptose 7-phosphate kinase / D-beta-D-heptose 1-phosphate adenosyltransferase